MVFTRTGRCLDSVLFSQKPADQCNLESLFNQPYAAQVIFISLDPTPILTTQHLGGLTDGTGTWNVQKQADGKASTEFQKTNTLYPSTKGWQANALFRVALNTCWLAFSVWCW